MLVDIYWYIFYRRLGLLPIRGRHILGFLGVVHLLLMGALIIQSWTILS
jgi:hypothetical protein